MIRRTLVNSAWVCCGNIRINNWFGWRDNYCPRIDIHGIFSHIGSKQQPICRVFSNSVASTAMYAKQKRIELSLGWKLGLMAVPGTILGAFVSSEISPDIFKILFAFVLISSASYIFLKRKIEEKPIDVSRLLLVFSAGASFFAGIISSLFGIGGGLIFVPLMVVALGISMKRAAPTSQFILMFASFSGLIMHSMLGHPDYYQALLLSIGAFAGGILGARLSLEIKENKLKVLVIIVLVAAAIKLIIDSTGIF